MGKAWHLHPEGPALTAVSAAFQRRSFLLLTPGLTLQRRTAFTSLSFPPSARELRLCALTTMPGLALLIPSAQTHGGQCPQQTLAARGCSTDVEQKGPGGRSPLQSTQRPSDEGQPGGRT